MKYERLVYLYVSAGSGPECVPFDCPTIEPFASLVQEEGFFYLFRQFIKLNHFKEVLIVIESSRAPGYTDCGNGISILCVSNLNDLRSQMRNTDLLWVRGGWRSWYGFLEWWSDNQKRKILFYRANTNRGSWPFWTVVLDDLLVSNYIYSNQRITYPFCKPIDPTIFKPIDTPYTYDLCIGASHIHDKKNQAGIIPVLLEYRKQYGHDLKCVLPGAMRRSTCARTLLETVLSIDMPGMLSRRDLVSSVYNASKIYIHTAIGGQNDRGPLEAAACGTPVMIYKHSNSAPWFRNAAPNINLDNPELAAAQIHHHLQDIKRFTKYDFACQFEAANGIDKIIIPQFEALWKLIH
jgi:glycosyltransferase involved in cell wall biosynthesis